MARRRETNNDRRHTGDVDDPLDVLREIEVAEIDLAEAELFGSVRAQILVAQRLPRVVEAAERERRRNPGGYRVSHEMGKLWERSWIKFHADHPDFVEPCPATMPPRGYVGPSGNDPLWPI